MTEIRTYREAVEYLERIPSFRDTGPENARMALEPIREFCREMGNPQQKLQAVHVAGTNGKGTTCRYLASVFAEAGYRCGVFTSPHLTDFRERFTINGRWIQSEAIIEFLNRYGTAIEGIGLTYFEICTGLAFWWFRREKVDLAVLETGLGGRLDATNVVDPLVSVITSVGHDHQSLLGDNLADIAGEKAGIIKKQRPLVTGKLPSEAKRVIRRAVRDQEAEWKEVSELNPHFEEGKFILNIDGVRRRLTSGFAAPVNAWNIAIAWEVCRILRGRFPVPFEDFSRGVQRVADRYPNTGCFERLHPELNWFFDGAHNFEALQALKKALTQYCPISEWNVIFTLMKDKVTPAVVNLFSDFKKKYYYSPEMKRAAAFNEVETHFQHLIPFPANRADHTAILYPLQSEFVVFTGSLYIYNTVNKWVNVLDLK